MKYLILTLPLVVLACVVLKNTDGDTLNQKEKSLFTPKKENSDPSEKNLINPIPKKIKKVIKYNFDQNVGTCQTGEGLELIEWLSIKKSDFSDRGFDPYIDVTCTYDTDDKLMKCVVVNRGTALTSNGWDDQGVHIVFDSAMNIDLRKKFGISIE